MIIGEGEGELVTGEGVVTGDGEAETVTVGDGEAVASGEGEAGLFWK